MNPKMVILMREDLKMSPGKAAAQAGHAGVAWVGQKLLGEKIKLTSDECEWMYGDNFYVWGGMKKIILSVKSLKELIKYMNEARKEKLMVIPIFDEGLDTITCASIGPDDNDKIDKITEKLKLYNPVYLPWRKVRNFFGWCILGFVYLYICLILLEKLWQIGL